MPWARIAVVSARRRRRRAAALARRALAERALARLSARHAVRQLRRRPADRRRPGLVRAHARTSCCGCSLVTGLLGGFTTFSAFSVESLILLQRGEWLLALGHTLAPRRRRARLRGARLSARPRCSWRASRARLVTEDRKPGAPGGLENVALIASGLIAIRRNSAMRFDKLTTKFQQALADAQSLAVAHDNAYIEPAHLLAAMLAQDDGPQALLARAGVNVAGAAGGARRRDRTALPQVQGAASRSQLGRDLDSLLQAADKEAQQARRPVHRQRAVPARAGRRQGRHRPARCKRARPDAQGARGGDRRGARRRRTSTAPKPKASARR